MCLLILIANNLRLLPSSQEGHTPLLLATRKNDRATVQELLAAYVDVDYIEEVSVHALILVSVIWCLIQGGLSALMLCCEAGNSEMAELLLSSQTSPDLQQSVCPLSL